jgi:hypothetical protein
MNLKQGYNAISMAFMRKLGYYEIGEFLLALQLGHDESGNSLEKVTILNCCKVGFRDILKQESHLQYLTTIQFYISYFFFTKYLTF